MWKEETVSLYEQNLEIVRDRFVGLAERLEGARADDLIWCSTRGGDPNLCDESGGSRRYLHSGYDPRRESESWAAGIGLADAKVLYVFGIGLGYSYDALLAWLHEEKDHYLVYIEDDARVLRRLMETERGGVIARDTQVLLAHPGDIRPEDVALAAERGLLVMGPDCGTAIINGVGLGFANKVERGEIGMVAASGTGAQEISSILDRCYGMGITQLIGTGGRDVSRDVGGVMLKMGLRALIDDAATRAIVVVSKHPDPETADEIIEVAKEGKKPCIIHFTGQAETRSDSNLTFTPTLARAAFEAARAAGKQVEPARPFDGDAMTSVLAAAKRLPGKRKYLRGIFSGGTLAQEASFLLSGKLGTIRTNLKIDGFPRLDDPGAGSGHAIVDLGDDAFTRGRAHPMIDQSYRLVRLAREMEDPETAVILLDVVLGYGCHEAPGVEIAEAITSAWGRVKPGGDRPLVIAGICGTHGDPQGYAAQRDALEAAGVYVAEHNEGMCELALAALGGRRNG